MMNDLRHDPDEQWIDVPDGEQSWGRTVRTWVDDNGNKHVQTNVPRPVEQPAEQQHFMALFVDAQGRVHIKRPDGTIEPVKFTPTDSKVLPWPPEQPADHDCTPWTERTERRIAALEDAVNRIADRLQYLLLRLEGDGK